MSATDEYVAHGWALVPIPAGQKGPTSKGWNTRKRCLVPPTWRGNIGLAHAYSGTCALDIDDLDMATAWLAERAVDLGALLREPDAVMVSSGRPNRAKLLYALPEPLPSKKIVEKIDGEPHSVIDFRCSNARGTTVQDVLPPSIHPDTGQPYEWKYADDLVGDWRALPAIPPELHALWLSLVQVPIPEGEFDGLDGPTWTLEQLRERVMARDPDVDRDSWIDDLAVLHWETRGSAEGLELAIEWSSRGKKFRGRADVERCWRPFRLDVPNPKTAASWRIDVPATADDFDVIETPEPAGDSAIAAAPVAVGDVPKAHHLCTDQANAQRIRRAFASKLMVASGRFYFWTGTHWAPDEGAAHRCACRLSAIVKAEARKAQAQAEAALKAVDPALVQAAAEHPKKNALDKTEAGAKYMMLMAAAEALENWSVRCEMKAVQDAALGLLRKLLTVDQTSLDADPWALNCLNGTVDLRTGKLRSHRAEDRITKICPTEYDPAAKAPRFEAFVQEILGSAPVAEFIQRWFGYCATGSVREQKMVVHVGAGANGKGTLLNAAADVLGEYAGTAAPGLLTGSGAAERHPTEIADLFGRRLVTAHETDDGATLREGFVKQATGGDTLKGRWMRADFFEFRPTHKLQMLTNHKPQIRGQDFGIWRRVLLVKYPLRFGTPQQIAERKADRLRDNSLAEALKDERRGVLRWVVEGAVSWYRDGLNPPDSVLAAGVEYQNENDRVAEFVRECCELNPDSWAPITSGFDALYPGYVQWCKANGYQFLGRGRFVTELERVVPDFRPHFQRVKNGEKWTTTRGYFGVVLVAEFT